MRVFFLLMSVLFFATAMNWFAIGAWTDGLVSAAAGAACFACAEWASLPSGILGR